jgi:hypothetical protein
MFRPEMAQTSQNDCDLLTIPELARRARISPRKLRAAAQAGDLPTYSCGTAWPRVLWSDFLEWVRSTRVQAPRAEVVGTGGAEPSREPSDSETGAEAESTPSSAGR